MPVATAPQPTYGKNAPTPIFDSKRDNELIAAGTHLWCHGCLVARPMADVSPNPQYCQGCYETLQDEKITSNPGGDHWTKDGSFFITGGCKFGVTPTGGISCLPLSGDAASAVFSDVGNQREGVAKLEKVETPAPPISEHSFATSKHPGGRPIKSGEVHRSTLYRRRQKELQGALL